jgi:RND superfamily putative drug exporter
MPNTIFRSLSTGAVLVVIVAMAASMTLLPAVLALLGDKVNRLRVRKSESLNNVDRVGGFWDKMSNAVMRRPVIWLLAGSALLMAIAVACPDQKQAFRVGTLPGDVEAKQAFLILAEEFSGGLGEPVEIVIDGAVTPAVAHGLDELLAALAADPSFGPPLGELQTSATGDISALQVPLAGDSASRASVAAIERLRDEYVPAAFAGLDEEVLIGGYPAFSVDFFEDVDTFTPIVFVFVLGLSFVLLTVVFRSIVLPDQGDPVEPALGGAAYGAVVLFFQPSAVASGFRASGDRFIQVESIEAWLPLFLFSILFGLSMDYHVFLLTRIREYYDRSGDNTEAVAHGLRTTGAIITGAALIMVAVFGGFAAGDLVMMQQMGFGLAIAVFLDATIVRSILVPAGMRLLGDWNWYLPKWLQWLPLARRGSRCRRGRHAREDHLKRDTGAGRRPGAVFGVSRGETGPIPDRDPGGGPARRCPGTSTQQRQPYAIPSPRRLPQDGCTWRAPPGRRLVARRASRRSRQGPGSWPGSGWCLASAWRIAVLDPPPSTPPAVRSPSP